jgi:hypothetical protein
MVERRNISVFLLIRSLIPTRGPILMISSKLNFLPKVPYLNTIILRARDSTYEFGKNTIHSRAVYQDKKILKKFRVRRKGDNKYT